MKIFFLQNNKNTVSLSDWLANTAKEEVVICRKRITKEDIEPEKPDLIIIYNYKYKINEDVINAMERRVVNLHISYLPWNRGAHPNLWSILDDTPKGVTIHFINKDIDAGDIILQERIKIDENEETLASSYELLHREIQNLFIKNWEKIKNFEIVPKPQLGRGTYHSADDFKKIKHLLGEEGWNTKISELKNKIK